MIRYKPPQAGTLPKGGKAILKDVYQHCREQNPGENPKKKAMCSAVAWDVVEKKYVKIHDVWRIKK